MARPKFNDVALDIEVYGSSLEELIDRATRQANEFFTYESAGRNFVYPYLLDVMHVAACGARGAKFRGTTTARPVG